MTQAVKTRKRRSDRNHVIYMIENTKTGDQYIGITVLSFGGNAKRTLRRRVQKHIQRALTERKGWSLCKSIRKHGAEAHIYMVLEIVRGKAQAHVREIELISDLQPRLNTFGVR